MSRRHPDREVCAPTETDLDRRYGTHRPSARMHVTGAGWQAACGCSPTCPRIDTDRPLVHATHGAARDEAATVLEGCEHGPADPTDIYATEEACS